MSSVTFYLITFETGSQKNLALDFFFLRQAVQVASIGVMGIRTEALLFAPQSSTVHLS